MSVDERVMNELIGRKIPIEDFAGVTPKTATASTSGAIIEMIISK